MQTCTYPGCERRVKLAGDKPLCFMHKTKVLRDTLICISCHEKKTSHYSKQCISCRDKPGRVLMSVTKAERDQIYAQRLANVAATPTDTRINEVVKKFEDINSFDHNT